MSPKLINFTNSLSKKAIIATITMIISLSAFSATAAQFAAPDQYKPFNIYNRYFGYKYQSKKVTSSSSNSSSTSLSPQVNNSQSSVSANWIGTSSSIANSSNTSNSSNSSGNSSFVSGSSVSSQNMSGIFANQQSSMNFSSQSYIPSMIELKDKLLYVRNDFRIDDNNGEQFTLTYTPFSTEFEPNSVIKVTGKAILNFIDNRSVYAFDNDVKVKLISGSLTPKETVTLNNKILTYRPIAANVLIDNYRTDKLAADNYRIPNENLHLIFNQLPEGTTFATFKVNGQARLISQYPYDNSKEFAIDINSDITINSSEKDSFTNNSSLTMISATSAVSVNNSSFPMTQTWQNNSSISPVQSYNAPGFEKIKFNYDLRKVDFTIRYQGDYYNPYSNIEFTTKTGINLKALVQNNIDRSSGQETPPYQPFVCYDEFVEIGNGFVRYLKNKNGTRNWVYTNYTQPFVKVGSTKFDELKKSGAMYFEGDTSKVFRTKPTSKYCGSNLYSISAGVTSEGPFAYLTTNGNWQDQAGIAQLDEIVRNIQIQK
jgi:hypothetical protein